MSYFDGKQLFNEPKVEQHSSHMVMSNVYKDEKESYITIDTTFAMNTDLSNNSSIFDIKLHTPLTDVKSIEVISATVPLSWYNISESLNNSFFKLDGKLIKLPDNEYTEKTLLDKINQLLTSNGSASSFSIVNNKFKISGLEKIIEFDVDKYGNNDKYNLKSKLGYIMGFRKNKYNEDEETIDLLAEKFADIDKRYNVYLTVDDFTTGYADNYCIAKQEGVSRSNIIAQLNLTPELDKIPQSTTSAEIVFKEHKLKINVNEASGNIITGKRCYSGKTNLQKFKVYLSDKFGNKIDLNGLDFNFTFKIKHL
jgi:hypothetical protein